MAIPVRTEASVINANVFDIHNLYVVDDTTNPSPFFFVVGGTDYFFGINVNAIYDTGGLQLVSTLSQGGDPIVSLPNTAKVALGVGASGGGCFSWAAPLAAFVWKVVLDVTTKTSAACTLDIGYTATSATTLSDTIIDGVDVGTSTGTFDNVLNAGTNGAIGGTANGSLQEMKVVAGKWITGSQASGAIAGLAGFVYITYVPV